METLNIKEGSKLTTGISECLLEENFRNKNKNDKDSKINIWPQVTNWMQNDKVFPATNTDIKVIETLIPMPMVSEYRLAWDTEKNLVDNT